jgi:hypothetical protein
MKMSKKIASSGYGSVAARVNTVIILHVYNMWKISTISF